MIHVMLCAYNEEPDIHRLLVDIGNVLVAGEAPWDVLLVDDGSQDATVAEARRAAAGFNGAMNLDVLSKPNGGLGSALSAGFQRLLASVPDDDIIVTLDADNTHPPRLIPELVAALEDDVDVTIASRFQPGAIVHGVPRHRVFISEIARFLLRALLPTSGVRDYTCCFRAYRARILRSGFDAHGENFIVANGFEAVADILLRLRPLGLRAKEIPLDLDYSGRVGNSKMRWVPAGLGLLRLALRRRFEGPPRIVRAGSVA